jgi:hypothetical protein
VLDPELCFFASRAAKDNATIAADIEVLVA